MSFLGWRKMARAWRTMGTKRRKRWKEMRVDVVGYQLGRAISIHGGRIDAMNSVEYRLRGNKHKFKMT